MRTPIIAGNWKLNKTIAEAVELTEGLLAGLGDVSDREVLICPPYTALHALSPIVQETPIMLGAQDVFYEPSGAYTGAISAPLLRDLNCAYAIVGHSERRQFFGETDAVVNKKLRAGLTGGLKVIVCVGEVKAEREAGTHEAVVTGQIRAGLDGLSGMDMRGVVIAYEPVWAIGTGLTATAADAQAMHAAIRATLAELFGQDVADGVRIQYGGSVKPDNIDELMAQPDIDGALVGGAALKADSFLRIVQFTKS